MDWMRFVMGEVASVSAMAETFVAERTHTHADGSVQRISADVDDTYMATIRFENRALGQLWWSWAGQSEPITINGAPAFVGSDAAIRGDQIQYRDGRSESLLARFQHDMTSSERDRFFPLGLTDPAAISQYDWLTAIARGTDPETSGHEGLRDLAAAYAMLESNYAGRAVTLAEVLSGQVDAYQRSIDEYYGLV
jgi:predicted dehydrogenase